MRRSVVKERLSELVEQGFTSVTGVCHDCGKPVEHDIHLYPDVLGGPIWWYNFDGYEKRFTKCLECFEKDPILRNFQPTEVYSRIVGYLRPVRYWNEGKKEEYKMRTLYDINKALEHD